tara:strand:+ start:267 stop:614 length:348 start_codon:yes stop_codon:yes gene_type:complete
MHSSIFFLAYFYSVKFFRIIILSILPFFTFASFPIHFDIDTNQKESIDEYKLRVKKQMFSSSFVEEEKKNNIPSSVKIIVTVVAVVFIILLIAILNISLSKPDTSGGPTWNDFFG